MDFILVLVASCGLFVSAQDAAPAPAAEHAPVWLDADKESRILELRVQEAEFRQAGRFEEALFLAREVIAIRREAGQPKTWWEVRLAREHSAQLQAILQLPAAAREELASVEARAKFAFERILQGRHNEAIHLIKEELRVRQTYLKEDSLFLLRSWNNLASSYLEAGRYAEADGICKSALEAARKGASFRPNPIVISSLNNMANLYLRADGGQARAVPYLREGYALAKGMHRRPTRMTRQTGENLDKILYAQAKAFTDQGEYDQAELCLRECVELRRELYGEHSFTYLMVLNRLGLLLTDTGSLEEAEASLREAVQLLEGAKGVDRSDEAAILQNLGGVLRDVGQFEEAEDLLLRARGLLDKRQHPMRMTILGQLAGLRHETGDYAGAEMLYREVLRVAEEEELGVEAVVAAKSNLATLLQDKGDLEAAKELLEEAISLGEGSRKQVNQYTETPRNNLGMILADLGQFQRAREQFTSILPALVSKYGESHPKVIATRMGLAELDLAEGQTASAELVYRKAYEALSTAYPGGHPTVAITLGLLGRTQAVAGKLAKAVGLHEQALEMSRATLGTNHRLTGSLLVELGGLNDLMGDRPRADALLSEGLEVLENVRTTVGGSELDRARFAGRLRFPELSRALALRHVGMGRPEMALESIETGRARAILDLLERGQSPTSFRSASESSESQSDDIGTIEARERQCYEMWTRAESGLRAVLARQDLSADDRRKQIDGLHAEVA